MPAIMKPLDAKLLNKPSGQCAFRLEATTALVPFGQATVSFKTSSSKQEIRSVEDPGRPVIATDYSELSGSVDIEFQALNTLGLALAFLGKTVVYTQTAVAAKVQIFADVGPGDWLELKGGADNDANVQLALEDAHPGLVDTSVTVVKVNNGDPLPPTDYRHDGKSGTVQITKWPAGAPARCPVTVAFSAPAVQAAASRSATQLLQTLYLRGRFVLRQNNLRGVHRKVIIPTLTIGGDGSDVQMITDGNDVVKVKVSGNIDADYGQQPGFEYGYMVDMP